MVKNNKEAGNSLLSLLFFMIVLALLTVPIASYYDNWKNQKKASDTNARLEAINKAIHEFTAANGHYPCPADIRAEFDTPDFGRSASAECNTGTPGAFSGLTKRSSRIKASGAENFVRAGAVPVRTLGLPDNYIYDGYNHRYVYLVTEAYAAVAADGTPPNIAELDRNDGPGIFVEDINENTSTRKMGNAIYAVMSMGDTIEGSYSAAGALMANCPAGVVNCSLEATIQNTISRSDIDGAGRFTQTVRYDTPQPCIASENTPATVAFLLDNSTSMRGNTPARALPLTPDDIAPDPRWRIHSAQWALRRALIARNVAMSPENDPESRLRTYVVGLLDPDNMTYDFAYGPYSDSNQAHVEDVLSRPELCPPYVISGTPLGASLINVADDIGGGRVDGPPNKIIALVDGGGWPHEIVDALRYIRDTYGNTIQVNFIDTINNPSIPQAIIDAGVTSENATYTRTSEDPESLVYELLHRSNGCSITSVPEPINERYYCRPNCEESGTCPEPTCEETGTCPPPPTCEETGTCPPPTCEETGTCPPPTCEETGTCPPPTCEETGTCPPPPITFNGWIQSGLLSAPPSGHQVSIPVEGNMFKLGGYDRGRGNITSIGFDSTDDGIANPTYYNIPAGGRTVPGRLGNIHVNTDGTFTYNTSATHAGFDQFYYRGVVTDPGPSNGISTLILPFVNYGGSPSTAPANIFAIPEFNASQVLTRFTKVEVNGVEMDVPDNGTSRTFDGRNGSLTLNSAGDFTFRGRSGQTGMEYFYLKGPILESGDPLVIHDPVPLTMLNSYSWELNFVIRNGNAGRPLTGRLPHSARSVTVETVRSGGTSYRMTGGNLSVTGAYGRLDIRRDGYFSYWPNSGVSGQESFSIEGIQNP